MLLRRVGGRVRWIPGDLLAWPTLAVGLGLLVGLDVVANRVADGTSTVRILVAAPRSWLLDASGWIGVVLVVVGAALWVLSHRLGQTRRWGTAVRYLPFRAAAVVLTVATAMSLWQLHDHVTEAGSGGAQWRFLADPRTRWVNDATTVILAAGAVACFALSFGRGPAQASRERVPTTTAPRATTSRTMPAGVATQTRSRRGAKPDKGS